MTRPSKQKRVGVAIAVALICTATGAFFWHDHLGKSLNKANAAFRDQHMTQAYNAYAVILSGVGVKLFPDINAQAHLGRGEILFQKRKFSEAVMDLRIAHAFSSNDQSATAMLVEALMGDRQWSQAEQVAREMKNFAGQQLLIQALVRQDKYDDARAELGQLIQIQGQLSAIDRLDALPAQLDAAITQKDDAKLLDIAHNFVQRNNPEFALLAFHFILPAHEKARDVLLYHGYVLVLAREFSSAEGFARAAVALDPDNALAQYVLAKSIQNQGAQRANEAIATYERARKLGFSDLDAPLQQARLLVQQGSFTAAGDLYKKILTKNPASTPALEDVALLAHELSKTDSLFGDLLAFVGSLKPQTQEVIATQIILQSNLNVGADDSLWQSIQPVDSNQETALMAYAHALVCRQRHDIKCEFAARERVVDKDAEGYLAAQIVK